MAKVVFAGICPAWLPSYQELDGKPGTPMSFRHSTDDLIMALASDQIPYRYDDRFIRFERSVLSQFRPITRIEQDLYPGFPFGKLLSPDKAKVP